VANVPSSKGREPVEIDTSVAHVSRVYDYLLGGTDNFAVDRAAAEQVTAAAGGIEKSRAYVRANRRFLVRAVRYLAGEVGIRQFLDIGTGIPNADNVHGVALEAAPDARVVYVDNDPIVLAHAHGLLKGGPPGATAYVDADLHDPDHILELAAATLDFDQPVALMLVSLLHLVRDADDPYGLVERLVAGVPSGSYLVVTHLTSESEDMTRLSEAIEENPTMEYSLIMRSGAEIGRFFTGLELVEPGLVLVDGWRPDGTDPERPAGVGETPFYGGVARKP
jgi:hypothetical protein